MHFYCTTIFDDKDFLRASYMYYNTNSFSLTLQMLLVAIIVTVTFVCITRGIM